MREDWPTLVHQVRTRPGCAHQLHPHACPHASAHARTSRCAAPGSMHSRGFRPPTPRPSPRKRPLSLWQKRKKSSRTRPVHSRSWAGTSAATAARTCVSLLRTSADVASRAQTSKHPVASTVSELRLTFQFGQMPYCFSGQSATFRWNANDAAARCTNPLLHKLDERYSNHQTQTAAHAACTQRRLVGGKSHARTPTSGTAEKLHSSRPAAFVASSMFSLGTLHPPAATYQECDEGFGVGQENSPTRWRRASVSG